MTDTSDSPEARLDLLSRALLNLLARIDAEPTMSGHLRNARLRRDHGDMHETSDAIRAAREAVCQGPPTGEP